MYTVIIYGAVTPTLKSKCSSSNELTGLSNALTSPLSYQVFLSSILDSNLLIYLLSLAFWGSSYSSYNKFSLASSNTSFSRSTLLSSSTSPPSSISYSSYSSSISCISSSKSSCSSASSCKFPFRFYSSSSISLSKSSSWPISS